MFRDSAGPGLRALLFLLLSVTLITLNQRSAVFRTVRTSLSAAVSYPFQWTMDAPVRFAKWLDVGVTTQQQLVRENEALRVREVLLQSQLQNLLMLEKENAQLRKLLQSTAQISGRVTIARLLAVALNPNLQQVVLNKGSQDQVFDGQPVLDAHGVMGQVVSTGQLTSKVTLITDTQSAVPVEDYRNGMRAVAVGMGASGQLELINMPDLNDVEQGDLFVTSGLGLRYPVGYPVGVVSKIQRADNNLAAKIILTPMAHLNQTEQVLLSWPSQTQLAKAVQQELADTQTVKIK